ncbi:porin family protein [Riemerella columbina]|uniref:porin family protein n=1 Tax=Riemerella columbina TaxID=103810 RepID=UPI0026708FA9|nr:porin family protein [Riemerella columbina]WKS94471.1 PorT family protein [Riemerella columbina]
MKKVFLGLAVAVSSLTFAQQFGVKAGANFSSISKDGDFADTKGKTGFYAGVFMNAPLAENFSIQPEVIYNNVGAKVSLNNIDTKLNLDYISVPVMFQYNATPEFYLEAGPQFSFLVNSKIKSDNQLVESVANYFNSKDNYNSFDFGMGLGLGYNFTPNIGINARYVAGFTDLSKNGSVDVANKDGKNRNNTFQVGLGFKF